MKSYWMHVGDVPNPIELREVAMPVPGPTQALVKIHAAGLNRGEFIKGHGLHGSQGAKDCRHGSQIGRSRHGQVRRHLF